MPLLAVNVSVYVPLLPAAGDPLSVPVPFALGVNVTPLGSAPDSLRVGAGVPVVVTVNVAAAPIANELLFALVIVGAWSTVNVKACEAGVPTPLLAVNVKEYVPPVPAAGVPLSAPVPFPLSAKVTPLGSVPVSVSAGVGDPVVVTVNVAAAPIANVVLLALVITGAAAAVTVKLAPLLATPLTVTTTLPVVAPVGTVVAMVVEFQLDAVAAVPLKVTVLLPCEEPKFAPVMVTCVPAGPEVVERLVIAGPPRV
jgi:hypothetical protein